MSQPSESVKDTPINRSTVSMLATIDLEKEQDTIRERRLALRLKIEALAKVKGEKSDLTSFMKFDKLLKQTHADLKKADIAYDKMTQAVNKLRGLTIEMGE